VQSGKITVTLKPMRNGETVTLSDVSLDSTVHDVKVQYASKGNLIQDKIKLLLNKKPAADLKTLKDLGIESDVEFSVMLMAGAAAAPASSAASAQAADVTSGVTAPLSSAPGSESASAEAESAATAAAVNTTTDMLKSDEFWADLQAFLTQRLRDKEQSEKLAKLFKGAWKQQ
jgi:hypothetical protein